MRELARYSWSPID